MSEHAEHGHVVPVNIYVRVWLALMAFLLATVGASYIQMGSLNVIIMLTIAVIKMTLILLFFMHVRYSSKLVQVFAALGFFWVFIFVLLVLTDYKARDLPTQEGSAFTSSHFSTPIPHAEHGAAEASVEAAPAAHN